MLLLCVGVESGCVAPTLGKVAQYLSLMVALVQPGAECRGSRSLLVLNYASPFTVGTWACRCLRLRRRPISVSFSLRKYTSPSNTRADCLWPEQLPISLTFCTLPSPDSPGGTKLVVSAFPSTLDRPWRVPSTSPFYLSFPMAKLHSGALRSIAGQRHKEIASFAREVNRSHQQSRAKSFWSRTPLRAHLHVIEGPIFQSVHEVLLLPLEAH